MKVQYHAGATNKPATGLDQLIALSEIQECTSSRCFARCRSALPAWPYFVASNQNLNHKLKGQTQT